MSGPGGMLRAAFDTNVLISGLIGRATPSRLIAAIHSERVKLVTSIPLLEELVEVLQRPKFRLEKKAVTDFIAVLAMGADVVSPVRKIRACRDPKDDIMLECAVSGSAGFIVTGDKDLLDLHTFEHVRILTPLAFSKLLPAEFQ